MQHLPTWFGQGLRACSSHLYLIMPNAMIVHTCLTHFDKLDRLPLLALVNDKHQV